MSHFGSLVQSFRDAAQTEREKGTYFEELIVAYLKNEASYRDLYDEVWPYAVWAKIQGLSRKDTGIDLVARTRGTSEFHAIQCKLYDQDHTIQKKDIDSFFTASGKSYFTRRIIVASTNHWTDNAQASLDSQHPPVSKIDLFDLENSRIEWSAYQSKRVTLRPQKTPREHQVAAIHKVEIGLSTHERGKLIMACGTAKTFTSLKIAERIAGAGGRVLFLIPSLSLLSQTLTEWTQESHVPLHSFAVCSDDDVGKKSSSDDEIKVRVHELRYPATTDSLRLAFETTKRHDAAHMSVVFSTYHSIDVISQAQKEHGLPPFDLIVCDEAHRTTGHVYEGDDESAFVRVHDQGYLQGKRRLYMTATPRIYGDVAQSKAEKAGIKVFSMRDEAIYGPDLHVLTFSDAVRRELLVDYKVIVLAVEESAINRKLQRLLSDAENQIKVDDAAKIVGCWKALAKQGLSKDWLNDCDPMQRAVAFCQVIDADFKGRKHKISSMKIAGMFQAVVEAYQEAEAVGPAARLTCEAEHVDGRMNASEKEAKLVWLKAEMPPQTCRVLSNVRCLSEGVDVPALDAVLFLTPRNSQVDVVQSVGRVMRISPGKKRGYVVLPVVIPAGIEPHVALNDNATYAVVWQVLQALRSHDDRFDAMVNRMDLVGPDTSKMEVIAITNNVERKSKVAALGISQAAKGSYRIGAARHVGAPAEAQAEIQFEIGEIERAIYAKTVEKVGNRHHWEDWAGDIAKIANTHIDRIQAILENPENIREREAFRGFAGELRADLNDKITDTEIVEMLAQHLITRPIFETLFSGHSFASDNPISRAMQGVLDTLHEHSLATEADNLESFYESVRERARGIDSAQGKQRIVVELYEKFFRTAFPRMTDRLGIVYTPVEVVDFIIRSIDDILRSEFSQTLGSDGVHILDPFTGTGTFITRLMQSGLITKEQLIRKYRSEIHANEIVLLAYYIAAINIEATFHEITGGVYIPFEGICLTDTFRAKEDVDLVTQLLADNNARVARQRKLDIHVIMSNPPYSVGQDSGNDNNQNVVYPALDKKIEATYAARGTAVSKRTLYDSYVRAIRWSSDRIGNRGVIGFVTNAGFLDGHSADGVRRCLKDEFSSIYVFHLRGNQRTSGQRSKREGGQTFGAGSRAPIAISILVKNPDAASHGRILFHDIGDYLTREEKLARITEFCSIGKMAQAGHWQDIEPDEHGDWLRQRDNAFSAFMVMGAKKTKELPIFSNFSLGVATGRDARCYNASRTALAQNMSAMIAVYNAERERFNRTYTGLSRVQRAACVDSFIDTDPTKISWTRALKHDLAKDESATFNETEIVRTIYRPFTRHWMYFSSQMNEMIYQMARLFPDATATNRVICINGLGSRTGTTALMVDSIIDLNSFDAGSQCFPLYLYKDRTGIALDPSSVDLFINHSETRSGFTRSDAITDEALTYFLAAYPALTITKEDVFYYIYGLLHAPSYYERYADTLRKEVPRIPRVKTDEAFCSFIKAGRELADLHINYESVPPYAQADIQIGSARLVAADYRVTQMRYGRKDKQKDRSVLHYNEKITITGIPLEAYDYLINGKSALDWVVERQCVRTDKASGLVNDSNAWAIDTMGDARYPLDLFLRVITVSMKTLEIVRGLPALDILEEDGAGPGDEANPLISPVGALAT